MRIHLLAGLLAAACLLTACPLVAADPVVAGTEITLPAPRLAGPVSVEAALAKRRSVRQFAPRPLTTAEISQLVWAGQGITDPKTGHRTAPSAMAKYPLDLYLVTADWAARYLPDGHKLAVVATGDHRAELSGQNQVKSAPLVIVIAGTASRIGGGRAEEWTAFEAGAAAQNMHLQAVTLGLVSVTVGGYDQPGVTKALNLPDGTRPYILAPVGAPKP